MKINMSNGKVIIDGREFTGRKFEINGEVNISGNSGDIKTVNGNVSVTGDSGNIKTVNGNITTKSCTNSHSINGIIRN